MDTRKRQAWKCTIRMLENGPTDQVYQQHCLTQVKKIGKETFNFLLFPLQHVHARKKNRQIVQCKYLRIKIHMDGLPSFSSLDTSLTAPFRTTVQSKVFRSKIFPIKTLEPNQEIEPAYLAYMLKGDKVPRTILFKDFEINQNIRC